MKKGTPYVSVERSFFLDLFHKHSVSISDILLDSKSYQHGADSQSPLAVISLNLKT